MGRQTQSYQYVSQSEIFLAKRHKMVTECTQFTLKLNAEEEAYRKRINKFSVEVTVFRRLEGSHTLVGYLRNVRKG